PSPSPAASSSPEASVDQGVEPLPSVTKNPEEEERVRKEVLARIDLLKELTAKEKDYLYAQVERARGFTKLAIIPFVRGRTKPEQYQIDHMLSYLEKPEFKNCSRTQPWYSLSPPTPINKGATNRTCRSPKNEPPISCRFYK